MAWTDQCKLEAVRQIDHHIEQGKPVREALKAVASESDIPESTLSRWKYPRAPVVENDHSGLVDRAQKEWPKCKRCGTEDVSHASRNRPKKDRLCSECRREVEAEKLKAAQEAFDAIPVDTDSDAFWKSFVETVTTTLGDSYPCNKISQETLGALLCVHNALAYTLGDLLEQSNPPGG